MIFSAGLGTRLYPYTQNTPKALVKIQNKTLLEIAIQKFVDLGVEDIIVNVHHFADQVIHFLESKNNFGIRISISDERDELLETGGGIKKASYFFNESTPFFVHNVDVVSNIDLEAMWNYHIQNNALATLAVRNRETSRYLLFDKNNILFGWENIKTGEKIILNNELDLAHQAFSGIHIIDPKIFGLLSETGKFSIIKSYLRIAEQHKIVGFNHDASFWIDVGTPKKLDEANAKLNY